MQSPGVHFYCWLCDSERLQLADTGEQDIKNDNNVSQQVIKDDGNLSLAADSGQNDFEDDNSMSQQSIKGDNDVSLTTDSGKDDIEDDNVSKEGIKNNDNLLQQVIKCDSEQLLQCDAFSGSGVTVSLSAAADTSCNSNAEQHDNVSSTTTRQHRY